MLVNFLKFIHVLLALGLLGSVCYCLITLRANPTIVRLNNYFLWLLLPVVITGTLLVYPSHFTFHTPWIQAAYFLVLIFFVVMSALILLRAKIQSKMWWQVIYLGLMILLMVVVHDAVTKSTFFSFVMPAKAGIQNGLDTN